MSVCFRTAMGFLFAPIVGGIDVALVQATIRPVGEGPTWIRDFVMWILPASLDSYVICYTVGTVTFLVLRAARRESLGMYTAIGGTAGAALGFVAIALAEPTSAVKNLLAVGFFAMTSASVAACFAAIRGVASKAEPAAPAQRP